MLPMNTAPLQNFLPAKQNTKEKSIFDYLADPQATATLPSMRSVLSELESLTQNGNIRLDEVAQLVQMDQAMAMRVLRMANSVYYAPLKPIMDVQDAILY